MGNIMKKFIRNLSLRFVIQLAIVLTVLVVSFLHLNFGIEKAAPIDAYCPFGAVESFFTLLFKGEFLKRIFTSSFILLGIFFIATIILGRIFCGYFCPLGAIQEWLRFLGKKMGFKKDLELPNSIDKYLRYLKYIVLLIIIYYSFYLGDLIFRNYDPYNALMHLGNEFEEKPIGYIVLILIVVISFFSKSLWCRYLCPLGAFFGIIRKFSIFKIIRDKNSCVSCGLCNKNCPANLDIKTPEVINDSDCISCGKCIGNCPKTSLSYSIFKRQISKKIFSFLVIIIVLIPLIVAPFTPFWKTKPESNIVNVKGEINVNDIRGSNTLQYIIEITKIPLKEFQAKLNLPQEIDTSLKLKEIGIKYNLKNKDGNIIETDDFRIVIDEYLNNKANMPDCPFGKINCEFPGDCGRYVDSDNDKICDHSQ